MRHAPLISHMLFQIKGKRKKRVHPSDRIFPHFIRVPSSLPLTAGIIDKLVSSKYVSRNKRQLIATEAGRQLIEILPAYLTSPKMTADWENQLLMMERGEQDRQSFMGGITQLCPLEA